MSNPIVKVTGVKVVAVRPDPSDLRKIRYHAGMSHASIEEVTTVFKIYVESLPEPSGAGFELFVGERHIRKFSEFKGGLFFIVNDPEALRSLSGREVGIRMLGETEITRTGVHVPDIKPGHELSASLAKSKKYLPTKQEVLRE